MAPQQQFGLRCELVNDLDHFPNNRISNIWLRMHLRHTEWKRLHIV